MKLIKKIVAFLVILCLLPVAIIGIFSIEILNTRSLEIAHQNIELTSQIYAREISEFLKEIELDIKIWRKEDMLEKTLIENNTNKKSENYDINVKKLSSKFKIDADEREVVQDTFVVNKNDITIISNNPNLLNKKIFCADEINKVKNNEDMQITSITPYSEYIDGKRHFVMILPIFDDNEYCGFIGQSIDANNIKILTDNSVSSNKPRANLLDSDGNFVCNVGKLPYINLEDFDKKNESDLAMQLNSLNENDKYAFFNFEMQHEKQYAHYSAIGNTGWKLYTNVSKKEIFAPTKFLMKVIIAFFLFLAVIVVIISRYILKSYLKPIDALYKAILNASENGIFTKFEYDKNDEFGKISTAFNNMIKEKIVSTQKLLDANVEVQTIIENIPGGVYRCKLNEDLEFSFVSDGLLNLLDCEKNDITEIYDNKAINIVHQKDRLKIYKGLKYQEIHENMIEVECRLMRPDGSYVWVLNRSKMMINKNGEKLLYCVAVDITTSKAIQDELSQSRKQYRAILEQSEDIICEWNFIDDTASFSNFWFKKFGYYIPEDNFSKYVKKSNNIHPDDKEIFTEWLKNLRENTITNIGEFRIKTFRNDYLWVSVKSTIIKNDNEVPVKAVAVVTDVTSEKSRIQKLLVEAQTDLLTGIYNKITTETFVRNALRECNFPEDKPAMMVIDIDNFKAINDNLGHMLGDAVLCEIASNLKGVFRKNDIIGRIGGDEFLVFINGKIDIPNIEEKAKEISKRFLKKFVNKGESYNVSVSIGIARCPCDGTTFEELYMHADNALYFAKSQGKDCFAMFNESMRGMSQISDIKQ